MRWVLIAVLLVVAAGLFLEGPEMVRYAKIKKMS